MLPQKTHFRSSKWFEVPFLIVFIVFHGYIEIKFEVYSLIVFV